MQNVAYHIDKLYDYKVPAEFKNILSVGCRVSVPFGRGNNERQAIVIELKEGHEDPCVELKSITSVLCETPYFTEKMIKLAEFMKERTFCTLFDALKCMDPGFMSAAQSITVKMVKPEENLPGYEECKATLTKKQYSVLLELENLGTCSVKELCYFTGVTVSVINTLYKKGVVSFYEKEVYRRPYTSGIVGTDEIKLTKEQQTAFSNLFSQFENGGGTSLLYGVTGSGKTNVYLRLIDEVLKSGKGIIVLVPEISLTPQTLRLFNSRYGDKVAVFHSGLSAGERRDEWKRVRQGLAQIVVGTRSAVFAPFENLGLIIMDEEQEHTYKSEQSPRYHAREIARYRSYIDGALLVLASATPSLDSFTCAKTGKYTKNVLTERYGDSILPSVETVDMTKERKNGNRSEISTALLAAVMETFDKGHQSILLLNRRGYNTYVYCSSCGEVAMCPNCSIGLTYHRSNDRLMCHYCGYSVPFYLQCKSCQANDMRYAGAGTQHFEEELERLVPNARILRMDADTTMQKYSYDEKLEAFRRGDYDIMVGTQMVAKGLDFENVTLVGVLSADQQLYNDDYMSMENTFSLITQVVGRAGRGKYKGRAIIQTLNPENEVLHLAAKQDYESFYDTEIGMRKAMVYPPFCNICTVGFSGEKEEKVSKSALKFLTSLKTAATNEYSDQKLIVLGPMPEPVYKVSNKYRVRILIKCKNNQRFRKLLSELLQDFANDKANAGVTAIPDII